MSTKKKLIILLLVCFVIGGILLFFLFDKDKYKNNIIDINYKQLQEKLEKKESFILAIEQDGCSACKSFHPKLKKVANEKDVKVYKLNLAKLTEKQQDELDEHFTISGTPTVVFVTNGGEESTMNRIVGDKDETYIISKFKANGYIK